MFLEKIIASTKRRIGAVQSAFTFPFRAALGAKGLSIIGEVKRASPSKGLISEDFPYLDIARDYERARAAAISVLTEPDYFMGSGDVLTAISRAVSLPTLRKDFILDAYQIYEAKCWGASAVLLIAEILDEKMLADFIALARSLGLSTLVESHSLPQLRKALDCGAEIVGVNNRNLETFDVDPATALRLREVVPKDVLYVAESGIQTPDDIRTLAANGIDAVLIGETLMRSPNRVATLTALRKAAERGTR